MKIIVVGCGKVGAALTAQLSQEGHDIAVIDVNNTVVTDISNNYDVLGLVGNGASHSVQLEAGIEKADLLVAATDSDELNLLCCLIAKKAGGCNTVARVRNPVYNSEIDFIKEELGLSLTVNPEFAAATEAARILRFPSAVQIETFAKGRVEIIKVRIPDGSVLDGCPLSQIHKRTGTEVLICTVERGSEVYIANGDTVIQAGDKVTVVAKPEIAARFFKKSNINIGRSRDVILLGGGKVSFYLAQRLLKAGVNVKIIERNVQRCEELAEALHSAMIIHGDCMDQDLLLSEGIDSADGVAALMDYDEENILISLYIKSVSKAKIITKINNESFDNIIGNLGLECVINPKTLTGEYIARYIRAMQNSLGSNVETLYRLHEDRVEALEFRVKNNSKATNIPLAQLDLRSDLQVICISRKGRIILPSGNDTIEPGDSVVVITKHKGLKDLDDIVKR